MGRLSKYCKNVGTACAVESGRHDTPSPRQAAKTPTHPDLKLPVVTEDEVAADEKRATVRRMCGRRASSQPRVAAGARRWEAIIENLSARGIAIRLESRCKIGTILQIDFTDAEMPRCFLARVVRSYLDGASWVHGCRLLTTLSKEEIQNLLL
jgi:hypothetical protein